MLTLSDDVEPEDSKVMYDRYETEYYQNNKAEHFATVKDDVIIRQKYHPAALLKIIELRREGASRAAESFAREYDDGKGDVICSVVEESDESNETAGKANKDQDEGVATKEEEDRENRGERIKNQKLVPHFAWSDERVKKDLLIARRLVKVLDEEKELGSNPIINVSQGDTKDGNDNDDDLDAQAKERDAGDGDGDRELAHVGPSPGSSISSSIKELDLLLEWLWRVHRVDYYGGDEPLDGEDASQRVRTVRPAQKDDTIGDIDRRELRQFGQFFTNLDIMWNERCRNGDPLIARLQCKRVERDIQEFLEVKGFGIVTDKEGKEYWRCKQCEKMFKAKEFVTKHFKNKHEDVLSKIRSDIHDSVYLDNYIRYEDLSHKFSSAPINTPGPMMMANMPMMMGPASGVAPGIPQPIGMHQRHGGGGWMNNGPQINNNNNYNNGGGRMHQQGGNRQYSETNPYFEVQRAKAKEIQMREGEEDEEVDPRSTNYTSYTDLDSAETKVPILDYRSDLLDL